MLDIRVLSTLDQVFACTTQVHETTFSMGEIARKVEQQRSVEDQVREQALHRREALLRDQESEAEQQRSKMTDLIRRMEDELGEGKTAQKIQAERLVGRFGRTS